MKYAAGIIILLIVLGAVLQQDSKFPFEVHRDGRIPLIEGWVSRTVAYPHAKITNWGPVDYDKLLGDYITHATVRQHEHSQIWRSTPYQFRISNDGQSIKGREDTGAIPHEADFRLRIKDLQEQINEYKSRLKTEAEILDTQTKYFLEHNIETTQHALDESTDELREMVDRQYR